MTKSLTHSTVGNLTHAWNNPRHTRKYREWLKRSELGERNSGAKKYHYSQHPRFSSAFMNKIMEQQSAKFTSWFSILKNWFIKLFAPKQKYLNA